MWTKAPSVQPIGTQRMHDAFIEVLKPQVRLNEDERAKLERAAAGQSLNSYVKERLFAGSGSCKGASKDYSDAADAEAICEAVTRPTMRFVEIKSPEQQAILSLHRARDLIVRQRTQTINMLRGLLAEFGVIFAQGVGHAIRFAKRVPEGPLPELPQAACDVILDLSEQLLALHTRVNWYGRRMTAAAKSEPRIALLQTIPGIGPITASAIVATVGSGEQFQSGRDLSDWLGLTPINKSTGGKERLGRISNPLGTLRRNALPGSGWAIATSDDLWSLA